MRKAKSGAFSEKLREASDLLRAMVHPLRIDILRFIDENQSVNVNKIYNSLNLEQSITSQHLRILREAGLVETERDGKFIHYRVDYPRVIHAAEAIDRFLGESGDFDYSGMEGEDGEEDE